MTPVFALRYDVSPVIGMGHMRRAQTLASALQTRGITALHCVPDDARTLLHKAGVPDSEICDARAPLPPFVTHVLTDICRNGNSDAAAREIGILAAGPARIGVIDSMPPDHFTSAIGTAPDIVFTPYLNANQHRTAPHVEQWLYGPRYAILPPEFSADITKDTGWATRRILVTCGGADPDALTMRISRRLAAAGLSADVVIGALFSEMAQRDITAFCNSHTGFTAHHAPASLAPLIRASAFVIGRLGLTRYEVAALGRNALYLSSGTAYRAYLEGFESAGIARIFFDGDPDGTEAFLGKIETLSDPAKRSRLFRPNAAAQSLVDGRGTEAMIDAMLALKPKAAP